MSGLQPDGLSHSDTLGSIPVCDSPRIFAACRVLLRLQEPRHPPCALIYFFSRFVLIIRGVNVRRLTIYVTINNNMSLYHL